MKMMVKPFLPNNILLVLVLFLLNHDNVVTAKHCPFRLVGYYSTQVTVALKKGIDCSPAERAGLAHLLQYGMNLFVRESSVNVVYSWNKICRIPSIEYQEGGTNLTSNESSTDSSLANARQRNRKLGEDFLLNFVYAGVGRCRLCGEDDLDGRRLSVAEANDEDEGDDQSPQDAANELVKRIRALREYETQLTTELAQREKSHKTWLKKELNKFSSLQESLVQEVKQPYNNEVDAKRNELRRFKATLAIQRATRRKGYKQLQTEKLSTLNQYEESLSREQLNEQSQYNKWVEDKRKEIKDYNATVASTLEEAEADLYQRLEAEESKLPVNPSQDQMTAYQQWAKAERSKWEENRVSLKRQRETTLSQHAKDLKTELSAHKTLLASLANEKATRRAAFTKWKEQQLAELALFEAALSQQRAKEQDRFNTWLLNKEDSFRAQNAQLSKRLAHEQRVYKANVTRETQKMQEFVRLQTLKRAQAQSTFQKWLAKSKPSIMRYSSGDSGQSSLSSSTSQKKIRRWKQRVVYLWNRMKKADSLLQRILWHFQRYRYIVNKIPSTKQPSSLGKFKESSEKEEDAFFHFSSLLQVIEEYLGEKLTSFVQLSHRHRPSHCLWNENLVVSVDLKPEKRLSNAQTSCPRS